MRKYTSDKAEAMRLRALYRRAAMKGRLKGLPLGALKSLVGPDCAYHLYTSLGSGSGPAITRVPEDRQKKQS